MSASDLRPTTNATRPAERSAAPRARGLRLSVLANIVFAVVAIAFGARRWLHARGGSRSDAYAAERRSVLDALPPRPNAIVFLGDSLTDRGEWAELFGDASIQNRGVSGDTTADILARAPGLAAQRPARVFLLAGVNDLGAGEPVPAIARRYGEILDVFRAAAPSASLFCESALPVRPPEAPPTLTNARIRELNDALRRAATERSCAFVDLFAALSDAGGALDARFTLDGVHLTGEGYAAWARAIAPLVNAPR